MSRPPLVQQSLRSVVSLFGLLLVAVAPAAAQQRPGPSLSTTAEATLSVVITLLVGLALITLYREETEATTDWILQRPFASFGRGLLVGIFLVGLIVLLVLSQIGIVLLFVIVPILIILGERGLIAAGRVLGAGWWTALFVAVVLSGLIAVVPVLGWIAGFALSTLAYGAAYMQWSNGSVERNPPGPSLE